MLGSGPGVPDNGDSLLPPVDPSLYAALADALPDPVLVVAGTMREDLTDRRFVFANAAARELLRLAAGEGMLLSAVRDPEILAAVDKALFEAADAEVVHETTAAQPRSLRVLARPLSLGGDGRLALLTFHDETEVRRVERTRVDFLANASHELRTPLASLSGFIETLRGHARDDPDAREKFLGIMQGQADRMARLIADLTSLSRIELDEHVAPRGVVDLGLLVTEAIEAAGPLGAERRVRLDWQPGASGQVLVRGERDQIVQVVQNLLDNAIKYSPDGAAVRIEMLSGLSEAAAAVTQDGTPRLPLVAPDPSPETYAALRFIDLGPGIARQNLPRLSERFYRVDGQKTGARSGTGLGLAIVKHIMNRHRGGLVVASAEGEGSTFVVYFPIAANADVVVKVS